MLLWPRERDQVAKVELPRSAQIPFRGEHKAYTSQDSAEYALAYQGSDNRRRLVGKVSSRPLCRSGAQASVS
jgi:hypothetical protein